MVGWLRTASPAITGVSVSPAAAAAAVVVVAADDDDDDGDDGSGDVAAAETLATCSGLGTINPRPANAPKARSTE
jgi:hypothetical protein